MRFTLAGLLLLALVALLEPGTEDPVGGTSFPWRA